MPWWAYVEIALIVWLLAGGVVAEAGLIGWERRRPLEPQYWSIPSGEEWRSDAIHLVAGLALYLGLVAVSVFLFL